MSEWYLITVKGVSDEILSQKSQVVQYLIIVKEESKWFLDNCLKSVRMVFDNCQIGSQNGN